MKEYNIAVLSGDGIGPEVTAEAIKVLNKVGEKYDVKFNCKEYIAGGIAIDKTGNPLPDETLNACVNADSVLLGAVGGPKWDKAGGPRPEQALLGLRKGMEVYTNIRPAHVFKELQAASPLKDEILKRGVDLVIIRELTGGIYFGKSGLAEDGQSAFDTEEYSVPEIRRVIERGFDFAKKRRKKLTLVNKANIMETSRLWRKLFFEMAEDHPDIEVNELYVDNASMQLVMNPSQFDVIVTSNMFGDILSDEASMITGSIGMLPSASLGDSSNGLYEPIHGTAPDIAGLDIANPMATILSVAMMLRYSFDMADAADDIERAVGETLAEGYRTADVQNDDCRIVGTKKMGDIIAAKI